jgi:hypothetical protein
MTLFLGMAMGNVFLATLMISQYSLVMDFGLVVLPSWLLLWASPSFRRQLMATFVPNVLYKKMFGTSHSKNKMITPVLEAKPMHQISSIQ